MSLDFNILNCKRVIEFTYKSTFWFLATNSRLDLNFLYRSTYTLGYWDFLINVYNQCISCSKRYRINRLLNLCDSFIILIAFFNPDIHKSTLRFLVKNSDLDLNLLYRSTSKYTVGNYVVPVRVYNECISSWKRYVILQHIIYNSTAEMILQNMEYYSTEKIKLYY